MTKIGTLAELDVKPGDVVDAQDGDYPKYVVGKNYRGNRIGTDDSVKLEMNLLYRIVSRAPEKPKLWRDMTPEEKGALMLAHHEGKVIEICIGSLEYGDWRETHYPEWLDSYAYRIKPEPKVETVYLMNFHELAKGHAIVFTVRDGEPDCTSIKMEKL